jgi:hypothetical protein
MQSVLNILFAFFYRFPKNTGEFFLNIGIRSRFLALKGDIAFIFAVEQLSFILEKEKVKTIIKIEDYEEDILPRLKEISSLKERVTYFNNKNCLSRFRVLWYRNSLLGR